MDKTRRVRVDFQSSVPWIDPSKALELIDLLKQYRDLGLAPTRYGSSDARTFEIQNYSEDEIKALWAKVGGGILKTGKPWNGLFHIFFIKAPKAQAMSSFWIHIDDEYFRDEDRSSRFIDLCKAIYSWGGMDHGFVSLDEEYERKNVFGAGRGVGGANLKIGLPGVYWANFFGPVYVSWFGEERFKRLEGFDTDQLADGGWLVFGRDNIFEYTSNSVKRMEDRLIKHLGQKAFFEMLKPFKGLKTPDFWGN